MEDWSAEEFFRTVPLNYLFGDIITVKQLCALVAAIPGGQASIQTTVRLTLRLAVNFNALKRSIREKTGRAERRKRLQAIADGARQVRAELYDSEVLPAFIAQERARKGSCSAHEAEALPEALENVTRLAKAAAEKVPKGKGPTRYDGDGFSAQEMCAFIVRDLWREANGKWPGSQNDKAWDACDALWEAAGGVRGKTGERWPLRKAERLPPRAPLGAVVMRGGDGRIGIAEILPRVSEGSTS